MNITAIIDLVREIFNSKDGATKRIAAGLTVLYLLAQVPQVHDALIAFAQAHQAGIQGLVFGAVITALFKSPNKSNLSSPPATPELQEEKSNAASAGKS